MESLITGLGVLVFNQSAFPTPPPRSHRFPAAPPKNICFLPMRERERDIFSLDQRRQCFMALKRVFEWNCMFVWNNFVWNYSFRYVKCVCARAHTCICVIVYACAGLAGWKTLDMRPVQYVLKLANALRNCIINSTTMY